MSVREGGPPPDLSGSSDESEVDDSQDVEEGDPELDDALGQAPGQGGPRPGNEAFATAATGLRAMDLEGEPAEVDPATATDEEYYDQILDALKLYLSTSEKIEPIAFDQGIAQKLLTGNLSELRRGNTPWKAEVKRMQMIGMHNRTIGLLDAMRKNLAKGAVIIDLTAAKGLHAIGMIGEYDAALMASVLTQNPERVAAQREWATEVVKEIKNAGLMQNISSPWLMIGMLIFERLHSASEAARAAPRKELPSTAAQGVPTQAAAYTSSLPSAPPQPSLPTGPPIGAPARPPAIEPPRPTLPAGQPMGLPTGQPVGLPPARSSLSLPGL